MAGLVFRSFDLEGPGHCFNIVEGLHEPAQVRGKDNIAPGRDGRYPGNRRLDTRTIVLDGYIRGIGADAEGRSESWHVLTRSVMAVFGMQLDPGTLTLSPIAGGFLGITAAYSITARVTDVMPGPIRNHMSFQEWSIELTSVDPDWETLEV